MASFGRCVCRKVSVLFPSVNYVSLRGFAARRGTRERKEKAKRARKLVLVKVEKTPFLLRIKKTKSPTSVRTRTGFGKPETEIIDNVFVGLYYKPKIYSAQEAIVLHQQTHQASMYNKPNALIYLSAELDMSTEKKTRFLENFTGVIRFPHLFSNEVDNTLIYFCKNAEDQSKALDLGATNAGGVPLIKQILAAQVSLADYRFVAAHPDILTDLVGIRGLLKKRFPVINKGTIGADIARIVDHFKNGVEYISDKDPIQHDFGWIDLPIGKLGMPKDHIIANLKAALADIYTKKSNRKGPFITYANLLSPPSKDKFGIDISEFLIQDSEKDDDAEDVASTVKN